MDECFLLSIALLDDFCQIKMKEGHPIMFKRIMSLVLCICSLIGVLVMNPTVTSAAERHNISVSFIKNKSHRSYVEMMIDYYLYESKEASTIISTLKSGKPVVMFFEGASDNAKKDTNYRTGAVCIVLKWKTSKNKPYIDFYSKDCSTLPDHPLKYGAYSHGKGSQYGTATLVDGIYKLYTTNHNGQYAGFHVRTLSGKGSVPAVYMKKEGFSKQNATGINIHTRTSAKVSSASKPWSAGCILVGASKTFKEYQNFIAATYPSDCTLKNTTYKSESIKYCSAGTAKETGLLIMDRYLYRDIMIQKIYKNTEAVDTITAFSLQAYKDSPCTYNNRGYCTKCGKEYPLTDYYATGTYRIAKNNTPARLRPYSSDNTVKIFSKYQVVSIVAYTRNVYGNVWVYTSDGYWIYAGNLQRVSGTYLPK